MDITHESPFGPLDVPLLGRVVEVGEVITTTEEKGRLLIDQQPIHKWAEVVPAKTSKKGDDK